MYFLSELNTVNEKQGISNRFENLTQEDIERVKNLLNKGEALSPVDIYVYVNQLKLNPSSVCEKTPDNYVDVNNVLKSCSDLVTIINEGKYQPRGDWEVLGTSKGWSELKGIDGFVSPFDLIYTANLLCADRIEEIKRDNVLEGYSSESHIRSLQSTMDLINERTN